MLREAILDAMGRRGWSAYRLGKESGVPIRTVQEYTSGRGDLAGQRIDKLCAALGLELRPVRRTRAKKA